jgi:hypothetical protein
MFVGVKSCHPIECFLFYLFIYYYYLFFYEYHSSECICCRVKYWRSKMTSLKVAFNF